MLKEQSAVSSIADPEIKKSIDAMDTIPRTILVPLVDSYMKGALVVFTAYERGGWPAVHELYRNPPESTEHVLHPSERLFSKRDHPRRVTLPKLEGFDVIASDVLGELQWSVYFSLWKHVGDGHEEENWGGDRYAVLRRKDGKLLVLIATIWDTEYDAKIFYDAYLSTLKTRFPDGDPAKLDRADAQQRASMWVRRQKDRVYIVDGGDHDLMNTLVNGTTFE